MSHQSQDRLGELLLLYDNAKRNATAWFGLCFFWLLLMLLGKNAQTPSQLFWLMIGGLVPFAVLGIYQATREATLRKRIPDVIQAEAGRNRI